MFRKSLMVAVASLLCVCLVSCAYAEPFSIRDGVSFGMTVDEVKEKEAGLELSEVEGDWATTVSSSAYTTTISATTTLLGCEDSELYYSFDDNGLGQIGMILRKSNRTDLDTILTAMIEKYGPYQYYVNSQTYNNLSSYEASRVRTLVALGSEAVEWVLNVEGGIVSICLVLGRDGHVQLYYHFTPGVSINVEEIKNGI